MKKKFISVALFGALMLASTSVVTSCKDYDDDISGLQSQVTDNKKTLDEQIAALNTALETTKADVVAAQTTANEAVQAAKDAQSTGDEALKEAAEAKADAALATQAAAQAKEEAIEAAKAEVEALRQEIENMPEGDFVTNDAFTQKVNDLNNQISAIQEGLSKLEGLQGIDVTVNANAQAIEQLKNQMAAVEAYKTLIDNNASEISSLKNKNTEIDNAINLINSTIATLATSTDLDAVENALSAVEAQIEKINSNLSVLLRDELRSLVFKSGLYVDGIEAAEYGYLTYTTYVGTATGAVVDVKAEGTNDCKLLDPAKWNFKPAGSGEYNPTINVAYHLNPSSAKVNKEDLSFISRDVEVITREASAAGITLVDKVSDEDGILTVSMKANGSKIKAKGEGSIFALQAIVRNGEKGDTTITSDYAMLYASTLTPQAIAFASKDIQSANSGTEDCSQSGQNDHLYDTPNEALKNVAQVKVRYDNKDGIDLKDLVEMHYNWVSQTKNNGTHKVWKYGEEAEYGLTYEFNLIQYSDSKNGTLNSKYAKLTDGVLYPRTVDSNQETTDEQGESSIGKKPLVQVLVKDANGNVVLDGYIKVEITDAPEVAPEDKNAPLFDLSNADFGCNDLNKTLTWAEISDKLYQQTAGASKEEFEDRYKFDVNASSGAGNQYDQNHKLLTQTLGVVTEMPDPQGTTNNVLNWELAPAELQAIYEREGHTVTIYVKYASQYKNTYGDIYVPLKVTVVKDLTTNVSKKNVNFWFAADGTPNDALDQAIRLNVPYPQDRQDSKPYTVDVNQAWEGNVMTFSNSKVTGSKYYFHPAFNAENISIVGSNGTSYRLTVGTDKAYDIFNSSRQFDVNSENEEKYALNAKAGAYTNNKLYANGTVIAELNQGTGEITYLDNATAKAVLNSDQAQHSASGLYVYLGICASNSCDYVMPVSNDNPFKAFFLRPVDVKDNGVGEFVDGKQNGSTVDVAKLFNFIDWRDVQFVKDGNYTNSWLYAFYGFSSVKVDVANATTNMNGNDINTKKLTDVNPNIKLTQVDKNGNSVSGSLTFNLSGYKSESNGNATTFNAIVDAMGKIKYENQGLNVSDYDIRIPVEFTYDWGTIKTYVVCKVTRTQGN